jgi:hypothetical protein
VVFVTEPWRRDYGGIDAVFADGCGNLLNLHRTDRRRRDAAHPQTQDRNRLALVPRGQERTGSWAGRGSPTATEAPAPI